MSTTPIQLRLDDDQLAWLREQATRTDRTITWIVSHAVDEYRRLAEKDDEYAQMMSAADKERNTERASRARTALEAYDSGEPDTLTNVSDLITDLLHLVHQSPEAQASPDQQGYAMNAAQDALRHFVAESGEGTSDETRRALGLGARPMTRNDEAVLHALMRARHGDQ